MAILLDDGGWLSSTQINNRLEPGLAKQDSGTVLGALYSKRKVLRREARSPSGNLCYEWKGHHLMPTRPMFSIRTIPLACSPFAIW